MGMDEKLLNRMHRNKMTNKLLDAKWKAKLRPDPSDKIAIMHLESIDPEVYFPLFDLTIKSFDRVRMRHFKEHVIALCKNLDVTVENKFPLPSESVKFQE